MKDAKKLFVLTALIAGALALAGCDNPVEGDDYGNQNSIDKFAGTWTGTGSAGAMELQITSTHYNFVYSAFTKAATCYLSDFSGNEVSLSGLGKGILLSSSSLNLQIVLSSYDPLFENEQSFTLTKSTSPGPGGAATKLTVVNESVAALAEVKWSSVDFGTIQTAGGRATKNVSGGVGYLYFKANGISLRRSEIVTVDSGEETTITILDTTVVVDVNNTSSTGPLSTLGVPSLGTPSKPALTLAGDGTIQASWQEVSGATKYHVYYSTTATPPETPAQTVTETLATISGLTYDTTYYVWVQAVSTQSESSLSLMAQILVTEPTTTLAWSGFWIRNNETRYTSNTVGNNSSTWQTLTITTTGGCRLTVMLTASSESSDYGYASQLDGSQSTAYGAYQFRVSGAGSQTYTYDVPAGTHKIYFGYVKDFSYGSGNDNVTVSVLVE